VKVDSLKKSEVFIPNYYDVGARERFADLCPTTLLALACGFDPISRCDLRRNCSWDNCHVIVSLLVPCSDRHGSSLIAV